MDPAAMRYEDNANRLPSMLVPDLDSARPVFLELGQGEDGNEVARLAGAVGLVHADPTPVDQVPAEIAAAKGERPAERRHEPTGAPIAAAAEGQRGDVE